MNITIQADKDNDQLYILFRENKELAGIAAETKRLADNLYLDVDSEGRLVGIEIWQASKTLGASIEDIGLDSLVGVAEAAKLFGVKKPNFLRDYVSKEDFPRPVAALASGRIWRLKDLEEYKAQSAKQSA
ncbi:MAG: DUF2283 domain-containing protein [Candidatus Aquicultor sp.]|nr:DUF2283 domain-containing protein [Candidatus Aquicultor sp.]